jgi:DNA repair protein RecO (recombination protein O)
MNKQTTGIIIHTRKLGESSFLVTIFSDELGKIKGMARGSKKNPANLQIGNIVKVDWKRRLSTQLGSFKLEVISIPAAKCFHDPAKMQCLNYFSEILTSSLADEEPHPHLYQKTHEFLNDIAEPNIWERLAFYELSLLVSLGYGLSLSKEKAVPCPKNTPLMYVSPKSGRAVSEDMGKPYKDKLLPLPQLFGGKSAENMAICGETQLRKEKHHDYDDVFSLTGHFLTKAVDGKRLKERSQLIELGRQIDFE